MIMELKTKETEKEIINKLEIKYLLINKLLPYLNNPRKNKKAIDVVANSIKEFKFRNPIILDKNNEIVCGHTRILVAEKLGYKEIPTIKIDDLTPEQIKAFRIMDNKSQEYASWDMDLLKIELEGMENLELTGFTEAEIEKILDPSEKLSIGDKIPKYKIEKGDIYQLDKHRLVCGDSTDKQTYIKLIPKETSIQCVFTDPPYGVSYSGTNNPNGRDWKVIKGDDLRGDKLYNLILNSFKQVNQYLIKNGAVYVFHASSNQMIFETALNDVGFQVKQQLIWNKHHILGHSHYHWCHEPIFYCSRINEQPEFFGTRCNKTTLNKVEPNEMTIEQLRKFVNKIKNESTVWEIKKDSSKDYIHPTQKPTKLAERAIVNNSKTGDNILDPFAGSGSTLMACEQKGRICYTIELDPVFCSHIIERWENHTKKKAKKLNLGN